LLLLNSPEKPPIIYALRPSFTTVDAGIQDLTPSVMTLCLRSTRDQRGNWGPIIAPVRLYCMLQLAIFDCCPCNRTITPSIMTLLLRSIWNERGNGVPMCLYRRAFSLLSSSSVHLPVRPAVRVMQVRKLSRTGPRTVGLLRIVGPPEISGLDYLEKLLRIYWHHSQLCKQCTDTDL
jgi:hypothetical protein